MTLTNKTMYNRANNKWNEQTIKMKERQKITSTCKYINASYSLQKRQNKKDISTCFIMNNNCIAVLHLQVLTCEVWVEFTDAVFEQQSWLSEASEGESSVSWDWDASASAGLEKGGSSPLEGAVHCLLAVQDTSLRWLSASPTLWTWAAQQDTCRRCDDRIGPKRCQSMAQ